MSLYQYAHGLSKEEIDTPALLIDLDAMERNLVRMAEFFQKQSARLRPHTKTHKCPIIARKQLELGAKGICCQKLGEAEVMMAGGVDDILISNEIVDRRKILRLIHLAKHANIKVCVDNWSNAEELSRAALEQGVKLGVLIEVNVGTDRCGIEPGKPALALAEGVAKLDGLKLLGLQGYEGHCQYIPDIEDRRKEVDKAMDKLLSTRKLLLDCGFPMEIISAGGTGTHQITTKYPEVTEIQAGSYPFSDTHYRSVGVDFECALTVLATVMSTPAKDRVVLDCGFKTITHDQGLPEFKELKGAEYYTGGDEHGRVRLINPSQELKITDKVELVVSHCCTTVNLYDFYYGIRDNKVEVVWEITGRGKSQ